MPCNTYRMANGEKWPIWREKLLKENDNLVLNSIYFSHDQFRKQIGIISPDDVKLGDIANNYWQTWRN